MAEKESKLSALIDELTRKSALNEDELLLLKQEVDQERRKSMADQQKIKKIESVIQDNTYKAEDQIRELTNALDAERRKSMADEKRMKDIERALNEKIYFLNELTRRKSEDEKELNLIRE